MKKLPTYSVYDKKTDLPVFIGGTAEECAEAMGVTRDSFHTIRSKLRHGQLKSKKWEIFLDDEEVDGDE